LSKYRVLRPTNLSLTAFLMNIAVNDVTLVFDGDKNTSLLTVLHEHSLTATKLGCGAAQCGACVVWVDGLVQLSCDVPAWHGANALSITTLEGLHKVEPAIALALTTAFNAHQAAQCGYCLTGLMMRAAFLIKHRQVSSSTIYAQLDAHLCRCGSHHRIARAILQADRAVWEKAP
jgi:nicotinate dehydrogenase subunit A